MRTNRKERAPLSMLTIFFTLIFSISFVLMLCISDYVYAGEPKPKLRNPPAKVPQTGQTISYADGDDGYFQMGVPWPEPRFTDQGDGTVTHNLTGLMWTKNASQFEIYPAKVWPDAVTACYDLFFAGYDDWRLPNLRELHSLIDYGNHTPALPADHPFTDVQDYFYWSSTYWSSTTPPFIWPTPYAWGVRLGDGYVMPAGHEYTFYVWCVRGGN